MSESIQPTPPPPAPEPRRRRDRGLIVGGIVAGVLVSLGVAGIVAINGDRELPTYGPSMRPTLAGKASVNVDYDAYRTARPLRGEIVVVQAPAGYQQGCGVRARFARRCDDAEGYSPDRLVKRIVGVPGDRIGFAPDGVVVRDGVRRSEVDIRRCARIDCSMPARRVPADMYFLAGDNRPVSADSRIFGPVPLESIDGRVSLAGEGDPRGPVADNGRKGS